MVSLIQIFQAALLQTIIDDFTTDSPEPKPCQCFQPAEGVMMEPSISIPSDWLHFAQERRQIERDGMIMHDLFLEVISGG